MNGDLFVTGTDTNVGKTLLSALLVAALDREYWKPIQTGAVEGTDRDTVMRLTGIRQDRTHPETYIFDPPVSPHLAAEQHGSRIELARVKRPFSAGPLVIEGAGGVLVPVNDQAFMIDLMRQLAVPVVVASRSALGTINHTLLTVHAIRNAQLELRGVVMLGRENVENRRAIERFGKVPVIGFVPWLDRVDRQSLVSVFKHHFDPTAFA